MKLRIITYSECLLVDCEKFVIEPLTQDNSVRLMVCIIDINLKRIYYIATSVKTL